MSEKKVKDMTANEYMQSKMYQKQRIGTFYLSISQAEKYAKKRINEESLRRRG